MKQKIISGIVGKLAVMGISVTCGNNSDIAINTEFLDAQWSTGSKKIRYEALIFANEKNNIVYMYEKTTEIGHGLSFGSDSGTSFQSGKTLFRKVKSVQYSPDGKAYEYILDLGAIPKAVKETAKLYGWGFKTVINKNKAMYPAGYAPSFARTDKEVHDGQPAQSSNGYCSNCGIPLENGAKFCNKCGNPIAPEYAQPTAGTNMPTPQQKTAEEFGQEPKYDNQQTEFYAKAQKKSAQKGKVLGLIIFILLGVVRLAKIFEAEITLAGWVFSAVIFSAALFIQKKIKKRGRLAKFILWLVTVFILAIGLAIFSKNNSGVSTAKIENAHMTTAMNAEGRPVDEVDSYLPSTRCCGRTA
ncbi:MAG: zinc-ribbon domain-containing protein [Clostridiales bacterium]|nr:zinc-ribbon domain-containing protein [Clostridiales bacterium]